MGYFRCKNAVILNRTLFWIEGGNRLLVYNLNQNSGSDGHRCSLINLPESEDNDVNSILGESEGRVCYAKIRMEGRIILKLMLFCSVSSIVFGDSISKPEALKSSACSTEM